MAQVLSPSSDRKTMYTNGLKQTVYSGWFFFRFVPFSNLPSIFTEQRTTVQGQVYFLHTQTGVSTWHDPRIPRYVFIVTNSGPWVGFCACTDVS